MTSAPCLQQDSTGLLVGHRQFTKTFPDLLLASNTTCRSMLLACNTTCSTNKTETATKKRLMWKMNIQQHTHCMKTSYGDSTLLPTVGGPNMLNQVPLKLLVAITALYFVVFHYQLLNGWHIFVENKSWGS
jgi:hypothetical protein